MRLRTNSKRFNCLTSVLTLHQKAPMNPQLIEQALDKFNVASIGHFPTILEPLPRLTQHCGAAGLYVKRDDCSGLAFGGNKVRQLSYYLGDAIAHGADTILITGAVQSNYVRCTAAAAAKLGMTCHVQLEERVSKENHAYNHSGNVLLDYLFGATVTRYPHGEDEAGADASLESLANAYKEQGRKPYVIHLSMGHKPFGALGYVDAARELLVQIAEQSLSIDRIVVASGSGHTHAGLLTGLRLANSSIEVIGACVRRQASLQQPRVLTLCGEAERLLQIDSVVTSADVICDDSCLAPGYGKLGAEALDALKHAARLEGMVVDPVYTAKSLACAMAVATVAESNTLFLHTGGTPAIFGYEDELTAALA